MNDLLEGPRGFLLGFLAALVSTLIVLGAFVLALTEGGTRIALLPSVTATTSAATATSPSVATSPSTPTPPPPAVAPGEPTLTPSMTPTSTLSPTPSATFPQVVIDCQAPPGWTTISLDFGETLATLANQYGISPAELAEANCMVVVTSRLPTNSLFNVPLPTLAPSASPTPVPSATLRACGPPAGWVTYRVQPGDNLFRLSLKYRVTVSQLQFANCLGTSTVIRAGQLLYVPNVATSTLPPSETPVSPATPSRTPTSTPTALPTSTWTPSPTTGFSPTPTPTFTWTPSPTTGFSPTPTPTFTWTPSPTATPATSTSTATPTLTPVITLTPTPTSTAP